MKKVKVLASVLILITSIVGILFSASLITLLCGIAFIMSSLSLILLCREDQIEYVKIDQPYFRRRRL